MMMAVNSQGEQLWSTPQAYTLLSKAGLRSEQSWQLFSQQLAQWLANKPNVGYQLQLENPDYRLAVRLMFDHESEWVLRLIDGERPTGSELLRNQLEITERESEVLYWLANGKANREIAEILSMSPRTVNKHLEQIYVKLNVDNRTSAAGIALKIFAQENALL